MKGCSILISLAAMVTIMLFLWTCKNENPFSEYDGTNLISETLLSQWLVDDDFYMDFTDASGTCSPPSEFPQNPVYRLEIINLVPNGDFETGAVTPWTTSGGTLSIHNGSYVIAGSNTMYFNAGDADNKIYVDIGTQAADSFVQGANYLIRYQYRTGNNIVFEFNRDITTEYADTKTWQIWGGVNGASSNPLWSNIVDFPSSELEGSYPDIKAGSSSSYFYYFGSVTLSAQSQSGYIDNIRLMRTDITQRVRLYLGIHDTSLTIVPGSYRFSVYVQTDPAAGTDNRFEASSVTLGIESDYLKFDYEAFTDGTDGDWSGWTKLNFDFYLDPVYNDTIIELFICPCDETQGDLSFDIGSILISSPALELLVD
jgi:hypothetical protein